MTQRNNQAQLTSGEPTKLYQSLLLSGTPLIDLRSPSEFAQGAFPNSHSLPLMTDKERQQVGICYKRQGQQAAITLGHKLVAADIQQRIDKWIAFKQQHPNAWLYCFRGGLRSQISAQFLKDNGVDISIIPGGYKALRRYLIDTIESAAASPLTVIGGNTGCAKTQLVQQLSNGLDIEGLANHRGSSFGKQITAQPTQINYENQMAVDILNIRQHSNSFVVEDESRSIGSVSVPQALFKQLSVAPMVVINEPLEVRHQRLCQEYCTAMKDKYCAVYGEEQGWQSYQQYLHRGLYGIRKRLGLQRFNALDKVLATALTVQRVTGSSEAHIGWIAEILHGYYDPMYQYQLANKTQRIKFTGNYQEVKEWLQSQAN